MIASPIIRASLIALPITFSSSEFELDDETHFIYLFCIIFFLMIAQIHVTRKEKVLLAIDLRWKCSWFAIARYFITVERFIPFIIIYIVPLKKQLR